MTTAIEPTTPYDIPLEDHEADTELSTAGAPEEATDDYVYGQAGGIAPSGYVSDAELMLWLETKSTEHNEKLNELMGISQERSGAIKDLSHLKDALADAVQDPEAALAKLDSIEAAYAGTEFEEDIAEAVEPLRAQIAGYITQQQSAAIAINSMDTSDEVKAGLLEGMKEKIAASFQLNTASVDTTLDDLGRQDEITLTRIQDLMANIRQDTQLVSNIMSTKQQAQDGVVANIRA